MPADLETKRRRELPFLAILHMSYWQPIEVKYTLGGLWSFIFLPGLRYPLISEHSSYAEIFVSETQCWSVAGLERSVHREHR